MKFIKIFLYWLLQLTWGSLSTLVGFFVFLFVAIFKKPKFHRNGYSFILEFGKNWGGLSLGPFAFCGSYYNSDNYWYEHTRRHEYGHSIQNIILGPFWLFVIGIPSFIRYWYRNWLYNVKKAPLTDYDDIWFEGSATELGERFIYKHEK